MPSLLTAYLSFVLEFLGQKHFGTRTAFTPPSPEEALVLELNSVVAPQVFFPSMVLSSSVFPEVAALVPSTVNSVLYGTAPRVVFYGMSSDMSSLEQRLSRIEEKLKQENMEARRRIDLNIEMSPQRSRPRPSKCFPLPGGAEGERPSAHCSGPVQRRGRAGGGHKY